ncbi:hypothetical protein BX070DRAFT_38349 [Coemansia spiralis]|nr:hypothetical protein BX070DRAFT_38349 [Coemansia spiralis]
MHPRACGEAVFVTYLVLRGLPSEASGQSISGRVLIRLGHSLKVKRITIAFQSVDVHKHQFSKQSSMKGGVLIQQSIFDATNSGQDFTLWPAIPGGDPQELPFSFAIPGYIHETVRTGFGCIAYELKVTIHSRGFGINTWTQTQRIPVYRVPIEGSSWAMTLADSMCVQADWLGAVELQMLSDCASFADNTKLSVRAIVRPLQKYQMLAEIGLRLHEKVHCKTIRDRFGDCRSSERVVCDYLQKTCDLNDSLQMVPLDLERCFDLSVDIPSATAGGIQYSMNTARLWVTHELILSATVIDKNQHAHMLRISAPIQIVPGIALEASFAELPTYSKSCFDRLLLGGTAENVLEAEHVEQEPSWHSSPPPAFFAEPQNNSDTTTALPPGYEPSFVSCY